MSCRKVPCLIRVQIALSLPVSFATEIAFFFYSDAMGWSLCIYLHTRQVALLSSAFSKLHVDCSYTICLFGIAMMTGKVSQLT